MSLAEYKLRTLGDLKTAILLNTNMKISLKGMRKMAEYEIHLKRLIIEYLLDLWSDGKVVVKFKQKTFSLMIKNIIVADTAIVVVWMAIQSVLTMRSIFSIRLQEYKMMMLIRRRRVFF